MTWHRGQPFWQTARRRERPLIEMHAGVKRKRVEVHAACPADWSSLYLPRARHGDGDRSDSGRPDVASSPDSGGRSKVDASLDTQYLAAVRAAAHVSIWCQRALSSNSGQRRFMIAVRYQTRLIHHPRLVRRCAIISVRIACAVLSPRCSSRPASQRSWNCSHNRSRTSMARAAADLGAESRVERALASDAECSVAFEPLLLRITLLRGIAAACGRCRAVSWRQLVQPGRMGA